MDAVDKSPDWHFGLVLSRGRFSWAMDTWYWWIPGQHAVLSAWNWIACHIWGHSDVLWHLAEAGHIPADDAVCIHCCLRLKGCLCKEPITT